MFKQANLVTSYNEDVSKDFRKQSSCRHLSVVAYFIKIKLRFVKEKILTIRQKSIPTGQTHQLLCIDGLKKTYTNAVYTHDYDDVQSVLLSTYD